MAEDWQKSAQAWVEWVDAGDKNRTHLLDPIMIERSRRELGSRALDVGCGEGRFCRILSEIGFSTVGIDPIESLLAVARERHPEGEYVQAFAEELPFEEAEFDLVVTYVSMVDIPQFAKAVQEMARVLKPGGAVLMANCHPILTANLSPDWVENESGERLHWPIDRYFEERANKAEWANINVVNYHRPLSSYFGAFLGCGMRLEEFLEPKPGDELVELYPRIVSATRIPYFDVALWRKPT